MARRGSGTVKQARTAQPAEIGVVARLVDRAFDDPAMSGGMFILTLTVAAILSNAMFLQPASHPTPLLPTRAVGEASLPPAGDLDEIIANAVPVPNPRASASEPPLPVAAAEVAVDVASAPESVAAPAVAPAAPVATVTIDPAAERLRLIQRQLARLGLYRDAIDGITGPKTRAAISQYQATAGIAVTGEPSEALLDMLMQQPPTPVPAAAEVAAPAAQVAEAPPVEDLEARAMALAEHAATSRIQAALNKIGYGPLVVDGSSGPDTRNAIRRFELDNGLDISGTANQAVLDRLVTIGALEAG